MILSQAVQEFIRNVFAGYVATPYCRRTGCKDYELPATISREAAETMLLQLLVNYELLNAYLEVFYELVEGYTEKSEGLTIEEHLHQSWVSWQRFRKEVFLVKGLSALSDSELAELLCGEFAMAHELLADAVHFGELSDHWAAIIKNLDPSTVKWPQEEDRDTLL